MIEIPCHNPSRMLAGRKILPTAKRPISIHQQNRNRIAALVCGGKVRDRVVVEIGPDNLNRARPNGCIVLRKCLGKAQRRKEQ
jgi:hypothetical protein